MLHFIDCYWRFYWCALVVRAPVAMATHGTLYRYRVIAMCFTQTWDDEKMSARVFAIRESSKDEDEENEADLDLRK